MKKSMMKEYLKHIFLFFFEDGYLHSWNLAIKSIMMIMIDLNGTISNCDCLVKLKWSDGHRTVSKKISFDLR